MAPKITVRDKSTLHHYRIELPNLIDDMELSVYAFRLYAHLKRRAGDDGVCYEGTRGIAAACRMSVGQVTKAKAELVAAGVIERSSKSVRGGQVDSITMVDLWPQNFRAYCQDMHDPVSMPAKESVHSTNTLEESVHAANGNGQAFTERTLSNLSVHETDPKCSPGERKKIHENHDSSSSGARAILRKCGIYNGTIRQVLALGIDEDTLIASVEALHRAGWGAGAIANELRDNPPMKGHPYEQPQSGLGSPAAQAGATRPAPRSPERARRSAGSHNPTGGAELHNPGWMDREIAKVEAILAEERARAEL
jgi:hypothetical protein